MHKRLTGPLKLYIFQCSHCDLKYFGKREAEIKGYRGSGKRWINHLNAHKAQRVVKVVHDYGDDVEFASKVALRFSRLNKIKSSSEWANLKEEDGKDGGLTWDVNPMHIPEVLEKRSGENHHYYGQKRSDEVNRKISETKKGNSPAWNKGIPWSEETKAKMRKPKRKRIL